MARHLLHYFVLHGATKTAADVERRVRCMSRLLFTVCGSFALWILFVAVVKPEEMIVGAICTVLTAAFSRYIASRCSLEVRLRWADAIQIWWMPWYLVVGIWEIVSVLVLDLLHIQPARSLFRAAPFESDADGPVAAGRRLLAVVYTTATPNFIILGIDLETHWMLFYQLRKSAIPVMTRRLGAQA